MITKRMLDVYLQAHGDSDALVRGLLAKEPDRDVIAASWQQIAELMQSVSLLRQGAASVEFAARLHAEIREWTDSPETVQRAHEVAAIIHPQ